MLNQMITLKQRPRGQAQPNDFKIVSEPILKVKDDEFLVEVLYVSIDPTHRIWMSDRRQYMEPLSLGGLIRSFGVGKVIESKNPNFSQGDIVTGLTGWQRYLTVPPTGDTNSLPIVQKVPNPPKSLSSLLSIYGITGITAFFGVKDILQPQTGETIVVSAAAGAVGSIVGQLAKMSGAKVIGICGSEEKKSWLVKELNFDSGINYRQDSLKESLHSLCPEGVDGYFENVGGDILDNVLMVMKPFSRIALCGLISSYNDREHSGPKEFGQILMQRIKVQGFIISDYYSRWPEAISELMPLVETGMIRYNEDIVYGLEQVPTALNKLFNGSNKGKLIASLF